MAFKVKYSNSHCLSLSVLLTKSNILLNNVYPPSNDTRKSTEENLEKMMEALGHLDAAHDTTSETIDCITLGDFNVHPTDVTDRARLVQEFLQFKSYNQQSDIQFLNPSEYTHKSSRKLDRIIAATTVSNCIDLVYIKLRFYDSDHFPIVENLIFEEDDVDPDQARRAVPCWRKASDKALYSFSRLSHKKMSSVFKQVPTQQDLRRRPLQRSCAKYH